MTRQQEIMLREINRAIEKDDFEPNEHFEKDFLESMALRARCNEFITRPQDACLERIWKKATGK